MKTPEAGTEVFAVNNLVGASGNLGAYRSGFPVDMAFHKVVTSAINSYELGSRLTQGNSLLTTDTSAEVAQGDQQYYYMDGWNNEASANANKYSWMFRRAPGFFDVVCYTGNGTASTQITHNLGVAPELIIVKKRSGIGHWTVYNPLTLSSNNVLYLQLSDGLQSNAGVLFGNGTTAVAPTDSYFTLGAFQYTNESGSTYIAYLFASLAGISDIGSYTGNGSSVTVTTGFQPRFI
jgi:hypothetical protein